MARARNIKPGFFRNAELVELSFEARLLFIGLWTIADREGRLEDRPKQIKMELFPADNMDCDAILNQLAAINMVERYEVDGRRYLHVTNFTKHQNPHRDEKASTIPDRNENSASTEQETNKHSAITVQAPCKEETSTVAIGLIPDSLNLIPDSLQEQASPDSRENKKPSATASRLPGDWFPSDDDVAFCKANRPDLDYRVVADGFRDYWIGVAGAKGRKADWPATWRNWVRNQRAAGSSTPAKTQYQINQEATARAIFGTSNRQAEPRVISGEVVT